MGDMAEMAMEIAEAEGDFGLPYRSDYWTQRDGTVIRIADMSDGHVLNTQRLLAGKQSTWQIEMALDRFNAELAVRHLSALSPSRKTWAKEGPGKEDRPDFDMGCRD